jgi:uncharacterized membrane protein
MNQPFQVSMSRKSNFLAGLSVGAGVGVAAVLLPQILGRGRASRIIRLEKSIQVGRPVEEVFGAWVDWERLPRASDAVTAIGSDGDRTHWRVQLGGKEISWDAVTEQYIENQAIGWKSISGPKHTGRVTFSPIHNDTIVHITMNYLPPSRALRPFLAPMSGHMEGLIEKVLREFKASVESRPHGAQGNVRTGVTPPGPGTDMTDVPKTGTFGAEPRKIEPRFGGTVDPVGYGSPPDAKR